METAPPETERHEDFRLNLEAVTPELMAKKRDEVLAVIRG